jgi:predicted metal-binding membrane protein
MMLPALMPWLRVFGSMAGDAYPGRRAATVVAQFTAGYFVIWLAYSAVAAAMQGGLQELTLLRLDLSVGATLGGLLLIAAGLFQLTPLKEACLAHCRSPLSFFLARWDGGPRGPFKMGARHGAWCVGCCWALMVLSFVLGVMNLVWMAVLTAMIVAEQRTPRRWQLGRGFGVVLVAWGVALIATG